MGYKNPDAILAKLILELLPKRFAENMLIGTKNRTEARSQGDHKKIIIKNMKWLLSTSKD